MTATTADEIDAAILRELRRTGDRLVRWSNVRRRVPGDLWEKQEALLRLFWAGLIYTIKIGGTPYVSLGDDVDRAIAAKATAEGRVRESRCI